MTHDLSVEFFTKVHTRSLTFLVAALFVSLTIGCRPDIPADWKTVRLPELGLTVHYPPAFEAPANQTGPGLNLLATKDPNGTSTGITISQMADAQDLKELDHVYLRTGTTVGKNHEYMALWSGTTPMILTSGKQPGTERDAREFYYRTYVIFTQDRIIQVMLFSRSPDSFNQWPTIFYQMVKAIEVDHPRRIPWNVAVCALNALLALVFIVQGGLLVARKRKSQGIVLFFVAFILIWGLIPN